MGVKYLHIAICFMLLGQFLFAQENVLVASYELPSHNLVRFNKFLINPAFSKVGTKFSYANIHHRNQSFGFEDNNEIYAFNYNGRAGYKGSFALSLFNKREGVLDDFGAIANYAYQIQFNERFYFTFGANIAYITSGFSSQRANAIDDDPLLNSLVPGSSAFFQPGFNVSIGKLDFGLYAENLLGLDLKTNDAVAESNQKTYSGHIQYSASIKSRGRLFEDASLTSLFVAKKSDVESSPTLSGNLLFDAPNAGWLQAGYNSYYGLSAGLGVKIGNKIALGYIIEKGMDNLSNLGITHELSLSYLINEMPSSRPDEYLKPIKIKKSKNRRSKNKKAKTKKQKDKKERRKKKEVQEPTPTNQVVVTSVDNNDDELSNIRKELANTNAMLRELLIRQDSLEKRNKELEEEVKRLMALLSKRNNAEPLPEGEEVQEETKGDINKLKISNLPKGYYLILKVLSTKTAMDKAVNTYKRMGVKVGTFKHSANNNYYIYWKKFDTRADAINSLNIIRNSDYKDNVWLIENTTLEKQ